MKRSSGDYDARNQKFWRTDATQAMSLAWHLSTRCFWYFLDAHTRETSKTCLYELFHYYLVICQSEQSHSKQFKSLNVVRLFRNLEMAASDALRPKPYMRGAPVSVVLVIVMPRSSKVVCPLVTSTSKKTSNVRRGGLP